MFRKAVLSIVFATMLTLSFFHSQATAASTVWFCIETECSSMTVTFGGVTHPKTLNCENMLSFDGASAGTYSYSVSGCGLTSSGSVTVDGTSAYSITICPPSGWPCCPVGCGTNGDYKCSCSETTTTTTTSTTSTSTTTTSTSNTTTTTLPTVLTAPTLTVTTSGMTVSLSWTSVGGASGYNLYYAPSADIGWTGNIPMGTKTSMSASLWEGAAFFVAIQAYNDAGNSGDSNIEYFVIQNQTEPEFTVMTNPTDSQILSVTGSDGTTVDYYGTRDADGIPTDIDRFYVVEADGTATTIELDAEKRPKKMWTSNGVIFELSYVGNDLGVVTALSPDGSIQVNTSFAIEAEINSVSYANLIAGGRETSDTAECLIKLDRCGAGVTNADVTVTLTEAGAVSASGKWPAEHDGDGIYRVSLPTNLQPSLNTEDLRKAAQNIASYLGNICTALSATGDPGRFLMMMCPAIGGALTTVTGPGGIAIGTACSAVGVAVVGYCKVLGEGGVGGEQSLAERILEAIQDPNVLTGNVTIQASARTPGLPGGDSATATAPAKGPFPTIDITIADRSRVSNLAIFPTIPEALQPYDLITEIPCPGEGDYLTIDVVRSDDREVPVEYRFESPPIYGGKTQNITRAIPGGGDHGAATDTATVTLTDYNGFDIDQRTAVIEIPVAVPTITSISPESGYVDAIVTITGYGFGKTEGSVFFNTTPTGIFGSWSDTEITTMVPSGATSGDVVVRDAEGRTSNGKYFEVKKSGKIGDCYRLEFTPSDCEGNIKAPSMKLHFIQAGGQLSLDQDGPYSDWYTASGSITNANVSLSFTRHIGDVDWEIIEGTFSGRTSGSTLLGLTYNGTVEYNYSKKECDADHTLDNVPFDIDLSTKRCVAP